MLRKLLSSLLLLTAMAVPSLGQLQNTPTTVQAERMLLLLFSDPHKGSYYIQNVGLSPQDRAVVAAQSASFLSTHSSLVTTYNQEVQSGQTPDSNTLIAARDSAVNTAFANIQAQASLAGWSQLQDYLVAAQNKDMITAPPSDIVAVQKLGGGDNGSDDDDGGTLIFGVADTIAVDGSAGGQHSCYLDGYASEQFSGSGAWSTLAAAPAGATQMVTALDGTTLMRTSANGLYMLSSDGTFHQLSGAGKEISGSAQGGIYTIGTNNVLFGLNTQTNAWVQIAGAGYPFTTANHVAAGGPDYSVWVSSGSTVAGYIPSLGTWVTIGVAPSAPVSMTTYAWQAQYDSWGAYFIGANGQFYFAWVQVSDGVTYKGFSTNPVNFTGFTGTPLDIHFNGGDLSFVMRTTTGVFRTASQGSIFYQVSGQSGTVASSESVNLSLSRATRREALA